MSLVSDDDFSEKRQSLMKKSKKKSFNGNKNISNNIKSMLIILKFFKQNKFFISKF